MQLLAETTKKIDPRQFWAYLLTYLQYRSFF